MYLYSSIFSGTNNFYEVIIMKKLAIIVLAIALLIIPMSISVSAESAAINEFEKKVLEALDENVKVGGKTFHLPQEYVTQAENFLKTIDMTEAQADEILEKIADSKEIIIENNVTSSTDLEALPTEAKQAILANGKAASAVVDAELTYNGTNVTVTHDNTPVFEDAPIIKVTGAEVNYTAILLAAAAVITMLVAGFAVASKKGLLSK